MAEVPPIYLTSNALDAAVRSVLDGPRLCILTTTSPNGVPHAIPTWYLFDEDRFLISALSTSRKARNVVDRGQARVLVDHRVGWVSATGAASLITGDRVDALRDRVAERYLTEEGRKHFVAASGFTDDCVIEVMAERWMSWSVMASYSHMLDLGFSEEEIASWVVPLER